MNTNGDAASPVRIPAPSSRSYRKQSRGLLKLLLETERALTADPEAASTYLSHAITLLADKRQGELSERKTKGGLTRWQISCIDLFIREHLGQRIRTSELASPLGFSVSHFSQAFKQTTGKTLLSYIIAMRVEAAGDQMLRSAQPLSEIAISHGFCDQSHFCRLFKRETGTSPQIWRKLHARNSHSQPPPLTNINQANRVRSAS